MLKANEKIQNANEIQDKEAAGNPQGVETRELHGIATFWLEPCFFEMNEPSGVGNSCWPRESRNIGLYRFA